MRKLKGLPASPGYAIGEAFILKSGVVHLPQEKGDKARQQIQWAKRRLKEELEKEKEGEEGEIFFAHMLLLEDPEIWERVDAKLSEGATLGEALESTKQELVDLFNSLEDERFRSRADDIKDIFNRLLEILMGRDRDIPQGAIIVGEEILPSHIVSYEKWRPRAYISEGGSTFAHSSIIARAKGIPMVIACKGITNILRNGERLIVDGVRGDVIVNPSEKVLALYEERMRLAKEEEEEAFSKRHLQAITRSGLRVKVFANVGNLEEVEEAREMGAEGIGIFRTEFLLLEEDKALNKEEHLRIYEETAKIFYPLPVHIRLYDIGADKPIPFLDLPPEPNPALGLRGIRLLLEKREILLPQLMAVKEAHKKYPNISLILPMVSFPWEVEEIRRLAGDLPVGVMIETPASALIVSKMTQIADFLSIGTNDLLQYTLAVDRAGKDVGKLYDPSHPALWKLIGMVLRGANRKGKEAGICGEIAGEREFIPRLVNMGARHLSVSPRFIPLVKHLIRSLP
ncbi:phosphoenolpyruvate--protein phosphotransferase [bacterium]|nr:phosphoenolpyruvate--protein phosphotransferase [bacterium]